jgi:hypothetical protein
MENLVPSDAYDVDETGYWKRMPLLVGLASGLLFGLWISSSFILSLFTFSIFFVLTFLMGRTVALMSRRKVSPSIEAIYAGYSGVAVLPPSDKEFSYRVPCIWMKFGNFAVPGVLYIGREGLMFMPHSHKQNRPQIQKPFEMTHLDNIKLRLVEPQFDFFHRLLHERIPSYLEIEWKNGKTQFAVPEVEQTMEKIESAIKSLKDKLLHSSDVKTQLSELSNMRPPRQASELPITNFDEEGLTPLEKVIRDSKKE